MAFDKMLGRDQEKVDSDDDMEGDVLILNPAKIGKHLPSIEFNKQIGRPEPKIDEKEELILEPNIDTIRPKVPSAPDFSKQTGR